MPNAIKSIGAGVCDRCGQAYYLGDLLTYSIKRPGERYHFPSCIDAVLSGAAHAAPIAPIAATAPVHTPVERVAVAPVAAIPAPVAAIEEIAPVAPVYAPVPKAGPA